MKDSLDILLVNVTEDVTEYESEFVTHDSLNILRTDVICHHGVLGMKWGIRRYQNKDGSLTAAGKKRYVKNWDKSNRYNDAYSRHKFNTNRRKNISKMINDDEMINLHKAAYSGNKDLDYNVEKHKIVERLTGEKFNINDPAHERLNLDLDFAFAEDKFKGDKLQKLYNETEIESRNNHAPEGYKLSEWSKDPSKEIIYNKETPKYVLQFEPRQHDDKPSKVHDDFEKNSDKILKQSFDAAYKDIKDRLGEDFNVTKEEFIKYLDKPQVRITPDWNMAEITTFDSYTDHFPTIEYDLKNKKVLNTSLQG